MGSAENAYLFRHAMMRLAAYELQPPVERSVLHAHAYSIIEQLPHEEPDAFAYELAGHARDAAFGDADERRRSEMLGREAGWLDRAMHRARNNSNFRIALECAERLMENASAELSARHSAALLGAEMAASLGEFTRVPALIARAESLQTEAEPALRAAWILSYVNAVCLPKRKYDTSINLLREALEIYRHAGDRMGEARAIGYLGNVYARLDQRAEAVMEYEKSEAVFRNLGHMRGVSTCRGNLGLMYRYFNQLDKAEAAYHEALRIDREIGNREGIPRHLGNLGVLYRDTGRLEEALALFEETGDLFRELGERSGWMRNANNHATCFELMGQLHRAVALFQQAERVAEECGLAHDMADCAFHRGEALLKLDDTVRGEPILELAATRYERLNEFSLAAETWEILAGSAFKREENDAVLRYTSAALQNLRAAEVAPCFNLLALHAEAALGQNRLAEAAQAAADALALGTTGDPIRMATLKAIAKKGRASSAT